MKAGGGDRVLPPLKAGLQKLNKSPEGLVCPSALFTTAVNPAMVHQKENGEEPDRCTQVISITIGRKGCRLQWWDSLTEGTQNERAGKITLAKFCSCAILGQAKGLVMQNTDQWLLR